MRVLLVGSGAREHALAWRLAPSPSLSELHAAPGNPGIAGLGYCHPVRADDGDGLLDLARTLGADLVVIGPEAPLVAGVADELRHAGIAVFGPGAEAAAIEGSKTFAKEVMAAAGVPAAARLPVATAPCVVKADGLASGKGVFVCRTSAEVSAGVEAAAALGGPLVIEELLEGPRGLALRALRRPARPAARSGAGLQAGPRRRRGAEHRRYGRLLPASGARRRRGARRADPPARRRRARAPRHALHRLPVRRADADRRRPARARVQRPLRRPRDPGPAAEAGGRPARGAGRRSGGSRGRVGACASAPTRR